MFSVGFNWQGTHTLLDYYFGGFGYTGVNLLLCTGPIPEEAPSFNWSHPIKRVDDTEHASIQYTKSSVASFFLKAQQEILNGELIVNFVPISDYPDASNKWEKVGNRWERGFDWAELVDAPTVIQRYYFAANSLAYSIGDLTPFIYDEDLAGTFYPTYEINFHSPVTVDGVDHKIHGQYDTSIEYWDEGSGEWVVINSSIENGNKLAETRFGSPITTSKFRFVGQTRSSTHYFRIYHLKFWSETEPTFEPLHVITHAFLIPYHTPFTNKVAFNVEEQRPLVMLDVSDITGNGAVKLLDTKVGDLNPPQLMSCAIKVEELESD